MKEFDIKAGELIAFTAGRYSDYCFNGVWKAVKNCNLKELGEIYLTVNEDQRDEYSFEKEEFYAWIVSEGYFEEVDIKEFHSGDYSSWQPEIYSKKT